MPRPKSNTASAYDTALRFVGPEPRNGVIGSERWLARQEWLDRLAVATDAISFARKEEKQP